MGVSGRSVPSPEQRARDGRLAWVIVGCCAAVTITLVVVLAYGLSGSFTRMVGRDTRSVVAERPAPASVRTPVPTIDRPGYDVAVAGPPAGGGQVQKRAAPAQEAAPTPPRADEAELGEVRKQGATAENEAVKSRDGDEAPEAARGRAAPRAPVEPEDPAHAARRI